MQGFFVKTYNIGKTIPVPLSAKEYNSTARFKSDEIIPLVRLEISNDGESDETVVRFDNEALEALDYDFDALKFMRNDEDLLIWSSLFETEFSINGIPFPDSSIDIPLVINSPSEEILKIKATELHGLEDYNLTIKDLDQSFSINLDEINEYSFSAEAGTISDRFILTVSNLASGLPDLEEQVKEFNIFSGNGMLFIIPMKDGWDMKRGDIRIYDITGKLIRYEKNIEWHRGETKEIPLSATQGIYLVEISSPARRYIDKVNIRQ